jgi:signal transduction histidine kinase
MNQEAELLAEVEALRPRFPKTRELYREVCGVLFFRYGITPTANRLYQLVRKGSMGTPAQVLAEFWRDLRERSRVRIEHPELPEELRVVSGELVMQLWERAQREAGRSFEAREVMADEQVQAARQLANKAQEQLLALERLVQQREQELAAARMSQSDLGIQLATIQGRLASMTEMLRDQSDEMHQLRDELDRSRRDVARAVGEANALRVQLALARSRGSRKPLGGVPQDPDPGQEDLELDPLVPADESAGSEPESAARNAG